VTPAFDLATLGLLVGAAVVTVVVVFAVTLAVARAVGQHSVVDVAWGLGFVAVAAVAFAVTGVLGVGDAVVRGTVLALVAVWGLRLAIYIGRRNRGKGEDPRYAAMLGDDHPPGAVTAYVLRKVYLPQAGVMLVVSLPVLAAMVRDATVLPLVIAGAVLWLVGFAFEAVGDAQLAAFKADPANKGRVLDSGLWRYTRHPNYFGDACVWWGVFVVSAGHPLALAGAVGPLLMTYLLVSVTGKELTERAMSGRPGYDEYVRRTSGFLPLPPGSRPARAT
jgi:steroid 5-alpha reductase family enzyme